MLDIGSWHISVCDLLKHSCWPSRYRIRHRPYICWLCLGITKAYTTRVGSGPFPTEDFGDDGNRMGERGREFGTVTGRKRRCGWFDLVMVRQAGMTVGITGHGP